MNIVGRRVKMSYAKHISNPETPQVEKAKEGQFKSRGGGYVFKVDDWIRLMRFLIIGNEGGTYYANERQLTFENYDTIKRCLKLDGKRTVDTIVLVSDEGRGVKNAPAVFALAVCSVFGDEMTRSYANKSMPKVARFSTDLFTWADNVIQLKNGKKGKGLLRALGRWYTNKDIVSLAYQICKYPSRSIGNQRWSHADLLRLCRISSPREGGRPARGGKALTLPSADYGILFKYAVHGVTTPEEITARITENLKTGKKQKSVGLLLNELENLKDSKMKYVWAHEKAKKSTSVKEIVDLITKHGLVRESISPDFRNKPEVQKALLPRMPMGALIRNLGSITASGVLKPLSEETTIVIEKITNEKNLKKARIHPINVLMALKVYSKGQGHRTSWKPVSAIKDALEEAFYKAFNYVEPTGKRFLLGIDVSGSMTSSNWGAWSYDKRSDREPDLTPREAAAVVAMTIARTEKNYEMMAFSGGFIPLNITAKDSLETVIRKTSHLPFNNTDCSLPMRYAIKNKLNVDAFVVLTDNETNSGQMHPFEALKKYRNGFVMDAKLAVLAFTATDCSIADPSDAGMLDMVGLDSNVPKILSEFVGGKV